MSRKVRELAESYQWLALSVFFLLLAVLVMRARIDGELALLRGDLEGHMIHHGDPDTATATQDAPETGPASE